MSRGLGAEAVEQLGALRAKRIFVSGGAGVIGRELVVMLAELGAEILVGDLEPRPQSWSADVAYRQGDLNDITQAELEAFAPEVFFHLAASFERSVETPGFWSEGYRNNLALSHQLISCMAELPSLRRVVFASSYLIYDPALYISQRPKASAILLEEASPIRPRNLCGSAKHHHELELAFLTECPGCSFTNVSARIFRSYGRGSRDVISRWVRSLLASETIETYGVEGCFDYIFARDVARGLVELAASSATGVVNLGTGTARRISEVLDILGRHFPAMQIRSLPTEIPYEAAAADVTRLREQVGWSPQTSLEDAIDEIVKYERERSRLDVTRARASESVLYPASKSHARNVLITSLSKKIPLIRSVRRALAKFDPGARVHGADCDSAALGRHFVDDFWHCPRTDQLSLEVLREHCKSHGIRYLVPTRDAELPLFSDYRSQLARVGVEVLVSSPSCVSNCVDKLRFAALLETAQLPVIPTAATLNDSWDCSALVVKERFGSGSKNVYCDVSVQDARELAKGLESPIFQPYVLGREFSVDLYRDRAGEVHGTLCRTRDRVVGGESQITTLVESSELRDLCERVVQVLGFWGHATLQAIESPEGGFQMLECNARFGGASTLSDEAGLESFYWFLLEASGKGLSRTPFERRSGGLQLIRHAADHFVSSAPPS